MQTYATNSYATHSLLATINVLRSVIAAAAQVCTQHHFFYSFLILFSRRSPNSWTSSVGLRCLWCLSASTLSVSVQCTFLSPSLTTIDAGTIVEATSTGVHGFSGGAVLYQASKHLSVMIDTHLLRDRLYSYHAVGGGPGWRYYIVKKPCLVFLRSCSSFRCMSRVPFSPHRLKRHQINTWISGNVTEAVLGVTTWQWGIGMWAIIYLGNSPSYMSVASDCWLVCSLPLMATLYFAGRRAKRNGNLAAYRTPFQQLGFRKLALVLFWQLDVIGIILIIAGQSWIYAPLTIT